MMLAREKPYKCDVCGVAFARSGDLTTHMRTHTGEKPYKCDVCGAAFAQNGKLTRHMRTHTGEKPYRCDVCGAAFAQNGKLTRHMRTHTGEKPYKCDVCGVAFARSEDLTTHMRTHTGEKPYKCDVCGVAFAQSGDLKRHMVGRHTSGASCTACQLRFPTPAALLHHLYRTHTTTTTTTAHSGGGGGGGGGGGVRCATSTSPKPRLASPRRQPFCAHDLTQTTGSPTPMSDTSPEADERSNPEADGTTGSQNGTDTGSESALSSCSDATEPWWDVEATHTHAASMCGRGCTEVDAALVEDLSQTEVGDPPSLRRALHPALHCALCGSGGTHRAGLALLHQVAWDQAPRSESDAGPAAPQPGSPSTMKDHLGRVADSNPHVSIACLHTMYAQQTRCEASEAFVTTLDTASDEELVHGLRLSWGRRKARTFPAPPPTNCLRPEYWQRVRVWSTRFPHRFLLPLIDGLSEQCTLHFLDAYLESTFDRMIPCLNDYPHDVRRDTVCWFPSVPMSALESQLRAVNACYGYPPAVPGSGVSAKPAPFTAQPQHNRGVVAISDSAFEAAVRSGHRKLFGFDYPHAMLPF